MHSGGLPSCREMAEYLESHMPLMHGAVLAQHSRFEVCSPPSHGISPGSAPQNAAHDQNATSHDDYRTTLTMIRDILGLPPYPSRV